MLAVAHSATLVGLDAHPVRVEVQATRSIPTFEMVGLAEAAVRESRVRVKSALARLGVDLSEYRIVVNLAPADLKKAGSGFDLAIAAATLAALGKVEASALEGLLLLGELSLDGTVYPMRGILPHLLAARDRGERATVVPRVNGPEAALVEGLKVGTVASLGELYAVLRGAHALERPEPRRAPPSPLRLVDDLADVRGQSAARRALEIAGAGAHALLMMGPPGSGKTMLARRLPGILPPLEGDELLEVMAIFSVAGLLTRGRFDMRRPFRSPHHTVSEHALVGGGETPRPGEVSLAHHGVLFLDELAELKRSALEALRQPLEDGEVTITRVAARATFPARPLLVCAANPCPCGHHGDPGGRCGCDAAQVTRYRARLSGPLLDRIDVHTVLPPVAVTELTDAGARGESSAVVAARVAAARAIQTARKASGEVRAGTNAALAPRDLERVALPDAQGVSLLKSAVERLGLSARAYGKVLRVARTLADLEGATAVRAQHVSEAIGLRVLDRATGAPERAA